MARVYRYLAVILGGMLMGACQAPSGAEWRVVAKFPHDPTAYTQGLLFDQGFLYESTGLNGKSSLRKVDLTTGEVLRIQRLAPRFFGEGLVLFDQRFIQLTWRAGVAFVYDASSLELLSVWRYETEGWGLTHDGQRLIMSDGTDRLFFRDPRTFAVLDTLKVVDAGKPVRFLNELEYINGEVWANVYQTNDIVRIDPDSGQVIGRLNFNGLLTDIDRHGQEDVLNGIAYDAAGARLFITGKRYGHIYQIEVCPPLC